VIKKRGLPMLQILSQGCEDLEDMQIGVIQINRIVSNEVYVVSCFELSGFVTRQLSTKICDT
jgi:hypothetical protein